MQNTCDSFWYMQCELYTYVYMYRLRQCCCHLSLLTSALHRTEMEQEQEDLELELAMGALSLDGQLGNNGAGDSVYVPVSSFIQPLNVFLQSSGPS